jgi:hypothetical protein
MRSLMARILGVVVAASMAGCATTEPSFEPTGAMPVTKPNVTSTAPVGGTVARVDPPQQVVVLDNGQMYQAVMVSDNVKLRLTDGNAFELRPPSGTIVRKGDPVVIDFTFGATPSASPR